MYCLVADQALGKLASRVQLRESSDDWNVAREEIAGLLDGDLLSFSLT